MFRAAEHLISAGLAYVDEQTAEQMRASRGDFGKPGTDSPFRSRTPEQNLARFREMRDGAHEDGSMVLRAKIDMASPNINLRDPAIYRIRRATHHNTGDQWCIYPMYTFAHPIEDALEQITHSLCTLEFEDQRPFYDWLLTRISALLVTDVESKLQSALQLVQTTDAQKFDFIIGCFSNLSMLEDCELNLKEKIIQFASQGIHNADEAQDIFDCFERETTTFAPILNRTLGNPLQLPRQYEFARLNLTYVITSKRKLAQLVYDHKVSGWDDPRMPTIVGLRRRGYTPESIQLFAERIGVTKSDSWIDYSTLEGCLREDLENKAHRGMAVLDPVKLVLSNWGEVFGSNDHTEDCSLPALPHSATPEGTVPPPDRVFKIGQHVWIEREDFEEVPPKGYKRLFPGNVVRLKGGYVIECTGCTRDAAGSVTEVQAKVIPGTKSGSPGADSVKAKAAITWVGVVDGVAAEVRLYDRLFSDPQPDAGGKDFIEALNPESLKVVTAYVEPSLAVAQPDEKFQFERLGYFVADRLDHGVGGKPVFNRVTGLKDSWSK